MIVQTSPAAEAVAEISAYIHATTEFERSDRLWPAHFEVFSTNPVGIAFGAAGVALFLHRAEGEVPPAVLDWIADRLAQLPLAPGLFNGAAGVAYTLAEVGETTAAGDLLDRFADAGRQLEDPSFLYGLAGWGWANVADHHRTGRAESLERAVEAADTLIERAVRSGEGWSWPADDGKPTTLGLGRGASGVALLFAALYATTLEERYAEAAERAIRFDLAYARDFGGNIQWGRTTEDRGTRPYWYEGGAGIGIGLVRVAEAVGDPSLLDAARLAEEGTRSLFTVGPSRLQGMAGIGEFSLDLYHATGDPTYLERAVGIAEGLLCFRVDREEGMTFPSLGLDRLSNDFATGSAGCGLFLNRLVTGRARGLYDLP